MFYLALSCLQGRPKRQAFDELLALGGAVQLTPGNAPEAGFDAHIESKSVRRHHGYCEHALRQRVWSEAGELLVAHESVHPPKNGAVDEASWRAQLESGSGAALELMYPGYHLGDGDAAEWAMDIGLPLAVDISHVYIQRTQGVMSAATWTRLQDYEHIAELHVSANEGRHDSHGPIDTGTFGLSWALERANAIPLVLECYMHRMKDGERRAQVALARHGTER